MSILAPVPRAELGTRFKYRGWFAFCPIYIDDVQSGETMLTERNGVPEFVLALAHWFQVLSMKVLMLVDPNYEPNFMFMITGRIEPR